MKIVLMIDWFLYYTVELANALSKYHNVLLVTRDHNFEIASHDKALNIDEFLDDCLDASVVREKLRYRRRSFRNILEIIRVCKQLTKFKPDVIHVQENSDWRILLIAKMFGFKKTVLTVHDVVRHPGESAGFRRYVEIVLRKRARRIIVHGNFLKTQLLQLLKRTEDEVVVLPLGALSIYRNWDDESVQEEENTILFFGRMSRYKGIDVLIKSQPLITKDIPNAKIIIAGRGEEFRKYENSIAGNDNFEIHNRFIANSEVAKFFRRAVVVILPYIEASQSGVVPIAYVFGKPVVVSKVGSIPEVVEDGKTGYVVPPNDPEALSDAVVKILKNKDLRENMGKNALEMASTQLSWDQIAQNTTEVYEELLLNE